MDVKSLYTIIPNNEGTEAVKEKLNVQSDKLIATKVIIKFLLLILTLNNFIFSSISYLQIKRFAMGTIYEPSYADIFVGKFESSHICPYIRNKTITYLRYIDDLFTSGKAQRRNYCY